MRWAAVLRLLGVAATVVVAGVVAAVSWRDGWFVAVLVGVPLVAAGAVLLATTRRAGVAVLTWVAAVVVLGWSVVTGLGTGGWFAGPGIVLLAAAVATSAQPTSGGARRRARG
ncbi:hypothetical protein Q9R32_16410 [Actinotalea sp. AC32]|nr:hypothetical protein [Actinotalea sp. AC32]